MSQTDSSSGRRGPDPSRAPRTTQNSRRWSRFESEPDPTPALEFPPHIVAGGSVVREKFRGGLGMSDVIGVAGGVELIDQSLGWFEAGNLVRVGIVAVRQVAG